jgi:AcrR family transcriptional regulator
MGRKAGITAEDTRAALLRAAAVVFARDGYDGASIADIAAEAGTSSGPIYVHFGSKADLFAATLTANADAALDHVLGTLDGRPDAASLLTAFGSGLSDTRAGAGTLMVQAIIAARHDPAIAALVADTFAERERGIARLVERDQARGTVDARVSPATVARFSTVVGLGALLAGAIDLPRTESDDWSRLIAAVTNTMRAR